MIEIAGLYEGKTKTGEQYFSCYLGKARLLVFQYVPRHIRKEKRKENK